MVNSSLDALHLIPQTLEPIHQAGGWYVVGLKANQSELYTDWVGEAAGQQSLGSLTEWAKGHAGSPFMLGSQWSGSQSIYNLGKWSQSWLM